MRRVPEQRQIVADVGQPLLRRQQFDRQSFQLGYGGQAVGEIDWKFTPRDAAFVGRDFAVKLEVLLRQFLQEITTELFVQNVEQHSSSAKGAEVVAQHLAFPAWIGEIEPALGLVLGFDQPRIDENSVDYRKHR